MFMILVMIFPSNSVGSSQWPNLITLESWYSKTNYLFLKNNKHVKYKCRGGGAERNLDDALKSLN